MEVVVTAGAVGRAKLQSNHYHQQTNTNCVTPIKIFAQRLWNVFGEYIPWLLSFSVFNSFSSIEQILFV